MPRKLPEHVRNAREVARAFWAIWRKKQWPVHEREIARRIGKRSQHVYVCLNRCRTILAGQYDWTAIRSIRGRVEWEDSIGRITNRRCRLWIPEDWDGPISTASPKVWPD